MLTNLGTTPAGRLMLVVLVFDDFAAKQAGKEPDEQERDEERSRERLFEESLGSRIRTALRSPGEFGRISSILLSGMLTNLGTRLRVVEPALQRGAVPALLHRECVVHSSRPYRREKSTDPVQECRREKRGDVSRFPLVESPHLADAEQAAARSGSCSSSSRVRGALIASLSS
jgi:hypothetical protein